MKRINFCFKKKRLLNSLLHLGLGVLLIISLFPSPIFADTITNSNVNINWFIKSQDEYEHGGTYTFRQIYQIDYVFDKEYVGWISSKIVYTYFTDNNLNTNQSEITKAIWVNGGKASITIAISSSATVSSGAITSLAQSIQNSNVVPYSEIETLEDILSVMNDAYTLFDSIEGLSNDQLTELENIVTAVGLSNDYLETITKMQQYDIYLESFNYVMYMLRSYDPITMGIDTTTIFNYPLFLIAADKPIGRFYLTGSDNRFMVILFTSRNVYNNTTLNNFFYIDGDATLEFGETINLGYPSVNGSSAKIIKFYVNRTSTTYTANLYTKQQMLIVPFYSNLANINNFGLEFALYFNLRNEILDNLQIIANGTSSSSSSSNELNDTTSQFQTDSNSLISIEDSFNSSMNSNLENINPTFNMGSSFLASANWVSTQFNRLVNNTPFSSLITFGLTLGLGLLIIGKIRK